MLGGIEAGGTKFVCGVGTGPDDLVTAEFPTSSPDLTLENTVGFFRQHGLHDLDAVGIASFGPVDLNPSSPTYGHITSTPKSGWSNFNLLGTVQSEVGVPVGFDTDVNAALLAEARWGAARQEQGYLSDFVYMTIGTGVGGGAMVHGRVVHGLVHPEMGHLRIPHDLVRDPFPGLCPYHRDCLEGLACGPAMQARWKMPPATLPPDHMGWALEARYVALGIANLAFAFSPRRILLGGGVMKQSHLFDLVRIEFSGILNGYVRHRDIMGDLVHYIQPPKLGSLAGVLGAFILAEMELSDARIGNRSKKGELV